MTRKNVTRGEFLRMLGLTSVMPFVPNFDAFERTLGGGTVLAAGSRRPKRLILLFSGNGTVWDGWRPGADGTFREVLAPLQSLRDRISVVDGLELTRPPAITGGHHVWGMATLWTGSNQTADGWTTGPSIDQLVANALFAGMPFKSPHFGVRSDQFTDVRGRMCHAGANRPIVADSEPGRIFTRIF